MTQPDPIDEWAEFLPDLFDRAITIEWGRKYERDEPQPVRWIYTVSGEHAPDCPCCRKARRRAGQ